MLCVWRVQDPLVVLAPSTRKSSLSRSSTFHDSRRISSPTGSQASGGSHSGTKSRMRRVQSAGPTRRRGGWGKAASSPKPARAPATSSPSRSGNSRRVAPAPSIPYNEKAFEMELGVPMDLLETAGT